LAASGMVLSGLSFVPGLPSSRVSALTEKVSEAGAS